MVYTSVSDIRDLTNLTISDISDSTISSMISKTISTINSKLNVKVIRERIEYIDSIRTNEIDGSNKTFYVKNWKGKYLSDNNNDSTIDTSDLIVYNVDSSNVETTLTVSSITYDEGKFVLSTAPTGTNTLYVSYSYSSLDTTTPDPLVNLLATYLVASYAFIKKDTGVASMIKFGNMTLNRKISEASTTYRQMYLSVLRDINSLNVTGGNFKDSKVKI